MRFRVQPEMTRQHKNNRHPELDSGSHLSEQLTTSLLTTENPQQTIVVQELKRNKNLLLTSFYGLVTGKLMQIIILDLGSEVRKFQILNVFHEWQYTS